MIACHVHDSKDGQNSIKILNPVLVAHDFHLALEDCKFFVTVKYKCFILLVQTEDFILHVPYLKVELVEEVVV